MKSTAWKAPAPTTSCPAVLALAFSEPVDTDTVRVVLDLKKQQTWFELDAAELIGESIR